MRRPQIFHPNVGKIVTFNPCNHSKKDIAFYGKMKIIGYEDAYYSKAFKQLFVPRYVLEIIEGEAKGGAFHANTDRVVFH